MLQIDIIDNEKKIKKKNGVLSVVEIKKLVEQVFKNKKKNGKMVSGKKQKHGSN